MQARHPTWKNSFFPLLASLVLVLSAGCGKKDSDSPSSRNTTTDQIVVIQTNPPSGGNGGPLSSIGISPSSLPQGLFESSAVAYTDSGSGQSFIYVIGGAYYDLSVQPDPINVNTVYRYLVQPDGSLSNPPTVDNSNGLLNLRGHSSVVYNNSIYVMGGIGFGGFQNAIYRATIKMDTSSPPQPVLSNWKWVGNLPVEETGQASVVSGDMLYVIGGVESGLPNFQSCSPNCVGSQSTVFSDKIYGYNLANYSTTSSLALTLSVPTYIMPKKLYTPAAAAVSSNEIWIFGGWDGSTNSDTSYLLYNAGGVLTCSTSTSPCLSYPLPYGGISKAISLFMPDTNQIFLLGGVSGALGSPEQIMQNVASAYVSAGALSWDAMQPLPKPVVCFSATSVGTAIYIFGGLLNVNQDC